MPDPEHPHPVLDYSADRRRTSVLAIVAVIVSIVAFPAAILLPVLTHTGTMRRSIDEGEVIAEFLKTALPLLFAEVLAMRSLMHVLHSRRSSQPLRGLDFAIAAVIFSTAGS